MRASNEALLKARVPRAGGRPGYPSRSCVRTRRAEERAPPPRFFIVRSGRALDVHSSRITRHGLHGSTVTSTNAGILSAPSLSRARSLKRKSFGSDTDGAANEAFCMLRSRSGTLLPRTWLHE